MSRLVDVEVVTTYPNGNVSHDTMEDVLETATLLADIVRWKSPVQWDDNERLGGDAVEKIKLFLAEMHELTDSYDWDETLGVALCAEDTLASILFDLGVDIPNLYD